MKFNKSFLSELIKLALPDVFSKFALITREDQKNGLFDNIIALKDPEENDQVCKLIGFLLGVSGFPFLRVSITKKREPISKFILIHFLTQEMFTYPFAVFSQKVQGGFPLPRNRNPQQVSGFQKPGASCGFPVPGNPKPILHFL
jgi:hypothetical protein